MNETHMTEYDEGKNWPLFLDAHTADVCGKAVVWLKAVVISFHHFYRVFHFLVLTDSAWVLMTVLFSARFSMAI